MKCGAERVRDPQQHEEVQVTESTDHSSASDATPPSSPRRGRSPLRKLSDEQELELTRLYSETKTPVPDIARRFGIGQSSVYRVSQLHGARLRSGTAAKPTAAAKPKPQTEPSQEQAKPRRRPGRPRRSAAQSAPAAASATTAAPSSPQTGRGRRSGNTQTASGPRRAGRGATQASAPRATNASAAASSQYRVVFVAETVIQAGTVREAIAQAEARGATEIRSIIQAD